MPAAVWLLHAMLAPRPPLGDDAEAPPPPRWLLGALFDCPSAPARKAASTLVSALVAGILEAELQAPPPPPPPRAPP